MSVHGKVRKVAKSALCTSNILLRSLIRRSKVPLRAADLFKIRIVINEGGGDDTSLEFRMGHNVEDEGDVGLHSADAAFLESTLHTGESFSEVASANGIFTKHGVIIRSNSHSRVSDSVHSDSISSRMAVDRDCSC